MKAILVKYHGATNTKGARYSADAEGVSRLYQSVDCALNGDDNALSVAMKLCKRHGWDKKHDLVMGGMPNGKDRVFVFVDKKPVQLYATVRTWFHKSAGNTYFKGELSDGVNVLYSMSRMQGGYDNRHFIETLIDGAISAGTLPAKDKERATFRYLKEFGYKLDENIYSVSRERDL